MVPDGVFGGTRILGSQRVMRPFPFFRFFSSCGHFWAFLWCWPDFVFFESGRGRRGPPWASPPFVHSRGRTLGNDRSWVLWDMKYEVGFEGTNEFGIVLGVC